MVNWPEATTLAIARAGDRAHQRRGHHADLRRPAAPAAADPERHVVEERDHAGRSRKAAKTHEDEDVGGGDVDRRAVDALGAEGEGLDDLREVVAAVDEGRRQVLAEEAVGEEDPGDDRQRPAPSAAAPPRRRATIRSVPTARSAVVRKPLRADQLGVEDPVVEPGGEAEEAEQPEPGPGRAASWRGGWRGARSRAAAGSPRASRGPPGSAACRRRPSRAGRPRRRRRCRRRRARRGPSPKPGGRPSTGNSAAASRSGRPLARHATSGCPASR